MMATRDVRAAVERRARRERGLGLSVSLQGNGAGFWQTCLPSRCGMRNRHGRKIKAGKVMRLKLPKTSRAPRIEGERRLSFLGLFSMSRCIITRLHSTTRVSIEFEKVWVW